MKISVIIPCYNSAKFLSQTLDSVLNQSYSDFEVLCVDNGSTDQTHEILDTYTRKDKRILKFSEPTKGAQHARNKGLKESSGDVIQFLDSDDVLMPEKFEHQLRQMIDQQADVVVSDRKVMDESLTRTTAVYTFEAITKNPLACAVSEIIITGNPLYKKEIVLKTGGYNPDLFVAQDWDFHIRLFLKTQKVSYVPGVFLISRTVSDSLSSNWIKVSLVAGEVLKAHKMNLYEAGVASDTRAYARIVHTYLNNALYRKTKAEVPDDLDQIAFWSSVQKPWQIMTGIQRLIVKFAGMRTYVYLKRKLNRKKNQPSR